MVVKGAHAQEIEPGDDPGEQPVGAPVSVWVDIRTTQAVVELGLKAMLDQAPGLVVRTEGHLGGRPDVVLYDVINLEDGNGADLDHLLRHTVSTVIAVDRTLKPELGTRAKEHGVEWAITLDISPAELVKVIEDASKGQLEEDGNVATGWNAADYLGASVGISPRESDVLQLVVLGHSNQEIADALYLSINSVKTYIRSTYRKIDATSRSQAILWAVQNGFLTERSDSAREGRPAGP
jgi:NarL family two-component system response regulator LiaR